MVDNSDLLVEIGTEEMPPQALKGLSEAFASELILALRENGLSGASHSVYATPRRLALLLCALPQKQQDQPMERKGPSLKAAFDQHGKPTRAAQGFARSCGVEVEALERMETASGAWLVHRSTKSGILTETLLSKLVEQALARIPIPKRMRWGSTDTEFVRPIHWVVLLFGDQVIENPVLGITPGRNSRGHRFHHPESIPIVAAAQYVETLARQGMVLADFGQRREKIIQQVQILAQQLHGEVLLDENLLDEVTALVEWPQAIAGSFDEEFLNIPPEVLITTMQDHQKFFPLVGAEGNLLPQFIAISNIESPTPKKIREGYERVIRPRFRDAEFFWRQDCKSTLNSRRAALKEVVFQHKLGSLLDKSKRLVDLSETIAALIGVNTAQAARAGELSKCDLLTDMVNEFPKLQGIMGRYYAQHDGEPADVAAALDEQYMPRRAGDVLPQTGVGQCLAIADRLDTLVGIFAMGQRPTGMKDPFGLRRAALGVLRILIERGLELNLEDLLDKTARGFPKALGAVEVVPEVFDYVMERLRTYYLDRGVAADVFAAVLATRPVRPRDFDRRINAVVRFRSLPEAGSLSQTNKRIRNILRKVEGEIPTLVRVPLLKDQAEKELHKRLDQLSVDVEPLFNQGEYEQGLLRLASLREAVDLFFDEVLVMAEDVGLRENRVALLNRLSLLFLRTADLSRLQN
jgi:glycyl-tRNA synthetase beta chain